jgi:hypothetical protein
MKLFPALTLLLCISAAVHGQEQCYAAGEVFIGKSILCQDRP